MKNKISGVISIMLLMFFLSGCDVPPQYIDLPKNRPFLIIEGAEIGISNELGYYRYTTRDNTSGKCIFHLDEKLGIGDTLWIGGKKCQ
jgi:hypothetical protein